MKIEVKKAKMTRDVIKAVSEIDVEFFHDFDYSNLDWYFQRYSAKNESLVFIFATCGRSTSVVCELPKLERWVRLPSSAPKKIIR